MMKNNRKEIQEELEKLAPSLAKLKVQKDVEVPNNYFNNLPDQILGKIDFPKNETVVEQKLTAAPTVNWLNQLLENITLIFQPRMAMGLGVVLILLMSAYFFTKNTTSETPHLADLSEETLESFVKDNIEDYDEETLFSFVAEGGMGSYPTAEEEELDQYLDEIIDDLDDEELEEFLQNDI